MNYHINARKRGLTWLAVVRIAERLAAHTGIARLVWLNKRGRAHIIAQGVGGYQHEMATTPADDGGFYLRLVGNVPPSDCIDWTNGELVECIPGRLGTPWDGSALP